jgi:ribonuclease HII
MEKAVATGIGIVSPERIDEINILQATYEAMRMAIAELRVAPDLLLNDAVKIPEVNIRQVPIIKGDAKSASIAAASIMSKVTRDRMMERIMAKLMKMMRIKVVIYLANTLLNIVLPLQ